MKLALQLSDSEAARREREELCADGCLDVKAAAAFTGLCRTVLFELAREGSLCTVKIRRRRLFPKRALVQLLAEGLEERGDG